jgi:hypothetical protein
MLDDGTIDVRETPGGATFVITLPFSSNPLSGCNQQNQSNH